MSSQDKIRSNNKLDNIKVTITIPKKLDNLIILHANKSFLKKTQWIIQTITEKIGKELNKEEKTD